ncbi:hypothetical protein LSAT2_003418 [Lamellibrachia satsuma]|nr:hypothetical protein LSAT2_003418 [Lamellibrachia satsuma]
MCVTYVGVQVTLHSSVVVTPKETRTRTDTLAAQNEDASGKARNRRMFGLLLGTLQRFRDDEKLKVEKEEKRKAVELKVEERAKQDKEDLRRERQSLFNKRRAEQAHMRAIQHKMELAEIHEEWEMQTKQLMKFIRTKTTPHIYYLPKISSTATDNKLTETHDTLQDIISERRRQLEEEIDEVTHHGDDAMEGGNTNHTMGDGVKTEHTREEEGAQGASGDGGEVDKDRKESDNEDNRSSSNEGEPRGDGPRGDWGNSNGDSVVVKKDAKLSEDSGEQCKEQDSSDSENGEEEKDIVRDEPGKDGDNGEKEKEESHRDKEDRHRDKERGHGDKEDKHRDKEDRHRDKEDRHKHKEDRHRDKESRHRYKEDRHRDKEDKHKDKEDKHKDKEDKHKDKDGSQRRHSHRSSRNIHKVESSPCHQKKAHSEDEGDSDEGHNRRKPRSESLSEKTKATKPDSRETEIGQTSDENGDSVIKKDGDMVKAAREEDVVMGEERTATTKVQEAMED